jgi:precorrin-6A/cobalt-precorrin-6A reductase
LLPQRALGLGNLLGDLAQRARAQAEGRALAAELLDRGCEVVSSLAGRITRPVLPEGRVRVGGFGAVEGLVEYLRGEAPNVVVDATHPFAQTMSAHAVEAAAAAGVRLIALRRPGWSPEAGDRWIGVPDLATAAEQAARIPGDGCVFVTTGRLGVEAYAHDERHRYLIRMVDPPTETLPPRHTLVLDRGP